MRNLVLTLAFLLTTVNAKPAETSWLQQGGNDWRTSCIYHDESVPGGRGYAVNSYA